MKRWLSLFLMVVLCLPWLGGCGQDDEKKTTLMVYMIGSDLEARAGAGTNDLQEMVASGVDLSTTNVVVYAGGTKKWHNELASIEEHTLLHLTEEGFQKTTSMPVASMGESASLTAFLNYAHQHYPAQEFALVMWDHGDGPVIGYGKDMLYDNDSLTLQEMQSALDASPFGADNKLAWVGFDACLMASAELACVWDDYARYLVASQEIEPSFGWNYDFLKHVGQKDTTDLLKTITEEYLTACEAYYEKKNFDNRDTTLACMDLSQTAALESALNGLFAKAAEDVTGKYDQLATQRVSTRALGRASTGSEYDLVDLADMADKLNLLYPTEAQALKQAIQSVVVVNANNTVGCCGMSLYYPFYNKPYFERDWSEAYSALGLFPDYQNYLKAYTAIWTKSDRLQSVAASVKPVETSKGQYALEMSQEQAAAYADSRYFILQQEGDGLYTLVFASRNITRDGTTLSANFNGNVLYAKNKYNQYVLPVAQEHEVINGLSHYSVYANLTNRTTDWDLMTDGFESKNDGYRFHLAVDNQTGAVTQGSVVAYDLEEDADKLMGGKAEDADLSQYAKYIFPAERHRYLERDENGVIKSVLDWSATSFYSGYELPVGDGLEFTMAPLVAGKYYLIYEIEDTQGNRYCSELLTIDSDGVLPEAYYPEPIELEWKDGEQLKLLDQENVTVYLNRFEEYGIIKYGLSAENRTDETVTIFGDNLYINNNVYCQDGLVALFSIPAGQTIQNDLAIDFGDAGELGYTAGMKSLQFVISIEKSKNAATLVKDQLVYITLSEQTTLPEQKYFLSEYSAYTDTVRGALATEQVITTTKEGIRVELLGLGGNGTDTSLRGAVRLENQGKQTRYMEINGLVFNDVYVSASSQRIGLEPGAVAYARITIQEDTLDLSMIDSIQKVRLQMRFLEFDTLEGGGGFVENVNFPVTMAQSSKAPTFTEGERVLVDEKGIRITLKSTRNNGSSYDWYLTLDNRTDQAISLGFAQLSINGEDKDVKQGYHNVNINDSYVGAGQKCVCELAYYMDPAQLQELKLRFRVMDFSQESALFELDTVVALVP